MIIKIEQTKSNLKNNFEIKVNNELKYLAGTPWLNIKLPLNMENAIRSVITKTDESLCYATYYNIKENISNKIMPLKWLLKGEQKSLKYDIIDNRNNICGKFYKLINGIIDTKYVIEYENDILKCYDISVGKTRNIFIHKDGIQIAEIIKLLNVSENLDQYYIFLLDEYSYLETIISFFTIYFDNQNYSNKGEIVGHKTEVQVEYTYDKNSKLYDKNWLENHFNKQDIELINKEILEGRKKNMHKIKKQAKYIIIFNIIVWLIVLIVALFASGII